MNSSRYVLDPFQVEACRAIESGHSVIVSAPTGAGKTLIAEYATERCRHRGERVIYTAPIKALSNQKYRDFTALYGDAVGIVTGDIVLNGQAPVLVMTTEILRNTIFEDRSQLDDVQCVIFDEIHYINDIDRGTVWEESIIFAPQSIRFVCLSATIPNLTQFSDWMRSVRDVEVDVVSETERPVPLEHFVYMPDRGVGSLKDLKRVQASLADEEADATGDGSGRRTPRKSRLADPELVEHLASRFRLPCLYFCFSRKGCEERARGVASSRSFLTPSEEAEILGIYDQLCARYDLAQDPRALVFRELVRCGVAYHHAGMFPTLKEVVERLFTMGQIQFLCTTETFAVGVNMPARSVVFDSLEKYDGVSRRYLRAREYWQMAGRAGRRGIDERGFVYAVVDPARAQIPAIEHILTGDPEPIESQFNLSYSSILNLIDQHGDRIFDVCRKSFGSFQRSGRIRVLQSQVRDVEKLGKELDRPKCVFGHDAMTLLTEHRNRSLELDRKQLDLRSQRSKIKRRYRGKRSKRARMRRLEQLDGVETQNRRRLQEHICHPCDNFGQCRDRYTHMQRTDEKAAGLRAEIAEVERRQRVQVENRLRVLEAFGYVDGMTVLPRGEVAAQIFGYEMQMTQLLFGGNLERLDEDSLNAIAVSIVFESKRAEWYQRLSDPRLRSVLKSAAAQVGEIRELEEHLGVDTPTKMPDDRLSSAAVAWSRGCAFEELAEHTTTPEGDLVRVFRSAIDLLRQMRRVLADHPALPDRISRCIDRLNRDVVDAERQLRADLPEREAPAAMPAGEPSEPAAMATETDSAK